MWMPWNAPHQAVSELADMDLLEKLCNTGSRCHNIMLLDRVSSSKYCEDAKGVWFLPNSKILSLQVLLILRRKLYAASLVLICVHFLRCLVFCVLMRAAGHSNQQTSSIPAR